MSDTYFSTEQIFQVARRIDSTDGRRAYLQQLCGDNAELREQVEALLDAHDTGDSFLESPASALGMLDLTIDSPAANQSESQIGPYKLLQKIGEGGMGVVYMADQTHPVTRRVAMKIIKPGMDSRQVIARFEAERQALAMMDHPNIARVLDAGTTSSGRPYFVMELVKGHPITEYCDEHQLSPRERLKLFVPVCLAVQHAHQKGIIHRDLKPSNVMLTEYDDRAVPKIIDFGIAKAIEQRLTEKTMFTQFGQVIGTVDYMSPEQAKLNQLDIDTRSDIYSLGVLLYELLAGSTPFDGERLRSAALDELLRIIREEEPPKPSLRAGSSESLPMIAANRQIEPKRLTSLIRGELDWIVMKALEKDRSRRYQTATELAEDVKRYLSNEPVEACPPSARYRFQKFVRRNKAAMSVALLFITVLLFGIVTSTWQAVRASRSEADSRRSEAIANSRLVSEQAARDRAVESEEMATRRLFDSYVAEAHANRWSGRPGQRIAAMEAVRNAAALLEPLELGDAARLDLRNEAIAALTSVDLREETSWSVRNDTEGGIAISPDFELFAADVRTAEVPSVNIRRFDAPQEELLKIAIDRQSSRCTFSADGELVAVAHKLGQQASVWKISSGEKLLECSSAVSSLSGDGELLAAGQNDGAVEVYDVTGASLIAEHPPQKSPVSALSLSPDSRLVAVAHSRSNIIEVRETASGAIVHELEASSTQLGAIAWHPGGQLLAAGGWQTINVWTLPYHEGDGYAVMLGHESAVTRVEFHPSQPFVASTSWDGTTRLWNMMTGDQLLELRGNFVRFSEDGKKLALGRGLDVVAFEIVEPEACRSLVQGGFRDLAIRSDGRLLAMADADGVRFWDLSMDEELARLPLGYTSGVAFHPVSGNLLTSGWIGIHAWPVQANYRSRRLKIGPPEQLGPQQECARIDISGDGTTLIVEHTRRGMRTWTATVIRERAGSSDAFKLKRHFLCRVAASPDGRFVATGNKWGKDVRIWNADDGKQVCVLTSHGSAIPTFSPDGRWIVTNGGEAVRFWEVGTWQLTYSYPASATSGSAVAFTPDGKIAAVARGGEGVLLVDCGTGEALATLQTSARRPRIEALCFTPDGRRIIAAAGERGIYNWDLHAIRQLLAGLDLDWGDSGSLAASVAEGWKAGRPLSVDLDLGPLSPQEERDSP